MLQFTADFKYITKKAPKPERIIIIFIPSGFYNYLNF